MFREVVLLEQHPGCTSRMRKEIPFLNQFKCALIRLITLNRTVGIGEEFQSIWHLYSTLNFGLCNFHRKTIYHLMKSVFLTDMRLNLISDRIAVSFDFTLRKRTKIFRRKEIHIIIKESKK